MLFQVKKNFGVISSALPGLILHCYYYSINPWIDTQLSKYAMRQPLTK